jgi:hypothetical protein
MSAVRIAAALGGLPAGAGRWRCRCPLPAHGKGQGDRNPSLSLTERDQQPVVVFCHAGCAPEDILAHLRRHGLLEDRPEPMRPPLRRPPRPVEHRPNPKAMEIWSQSEPAGELIRRYFASRSIRLDPPPSIHRGLSFAYGPIPFPTLVAAVSAPNGEVVAVQQLALNCETGRKAAIRHPRRTTGALGGGAVRLASVGGILGLAEGIETALSAQELFGTPCWAALGARRLARVVLPPEVREVQIFGDNDATGRIAAMRAIEVFTAARLRARLRFPPEGFSDWNDYAQSRAGGGQ